MDADVIGDGRSSPGEEKEERASGSGTPGDQAKVGTTITEGSHCCRLSRKYVDSAATRVCWCSKNCIMPILQTWRQGLFPLGLVVSPNPDCHLHQGCVWCCHQQSSLLGSHSELTHGRISTLHVEHIFRQKIRSACGGPETTAHAIGTRNNLWH